MPAGRPSTYTPEVADEICERISTGETLRSICLDDKMPAWRTVYHWMDANAEFSARIARAREVGADAIAMEALAIADTPMEGKRIKVTESGSEEWTEDMLGHRKLQIETRLKLLAKWNPARYGDKVQHAGADGESPVEMVVRWQDGKS